MYLSSSLTNNIQPLSPDEPCSVTDSTCCIPAVFFLSAVCLYFCWRQCFFIVLFFFWFDFLSPEISASNYRMPEESRASFPPRKRLRPSPPVEQWGGGGGGAVKAPPAGLIIHPADQLPLYLSPVYRFE